jgi:peptidoglycan/LPS O-acetylase OafA/YrhL
VISYGIYLYHENLIARVSDRLVRYDLPHSYPVVLVVSTAVTVAFATASFYFFERPLLRLKEVPLLARAAFWRRSTT